MKTNFLSFIQNQHLLQKNDKVLLAISGGVDSVVLAHLLKQTNFEFGLAHGNFQLRGEESDQDEAFVQQLAKEYKVPFFSIKFETQSYAETHGQSIQMAARTLRYAWLEQIRKENNYKFIVTAHHQNDVAETMIYNLTKGTGIAGLHGILPKNGKLIRPLLFAQKKEIRQYAKEQELSFREDATNQETKYTRNKIRHLVLAVLRTINPKVITTFWENAQRFREIEAIYQVGLEAYKKKLLEVKRKETLISIKKLQKIKPAKTILYEILKEYHYSPAQVAQILDALDAESGKLFFSSTHQIIKDRKFLILSEKAAKDTSFSVIIEGQTKLEKEDFSLVIEKRKKGKDFEMLKVSNVACLDAKKVKFPLMLRRWKQGDYFYPFGMKRKKKKLSRFFIDQKLSLPEKERVWVLEDDKERILWVLGMRIDERFRVTDGTKEVLQFSISDRM